MPLVARSLLESLLASLLLGKGEGEEVNNEKESRSDRGREEEEENGGRQGRRERNTRTGEAERLREDLLAIRGPT